MHDRTLFDTYERIALWAAVLFLLLRDSYPTLCDLWDTLHYWSILP